MTARLSVAVIGAGMGGLAAAAAAGLAPIKINAVLIRGSNLTEAPALLDWALRSGYQLRFIEHMPLDAQHAWSRAGMVTAEEMLALLRPDPPPHLARIGDRR